MTISKPAEGTERFQATRLHTLRHEVLQHAPSRVTRPPREELSHG